MVRTGSVDGGGVRLVRLCLCAVVELVAVVAAATSAAASELMGHADIKMTSKIYTHVQQDEKARGIATLSNVFPKVHF